MIQHRHFRDALRILKTTIQMKATEGRERGSLGEKLPPVGQKQHIETVCMSVVSAARDDTASASSQPAAGFGERENLLDRGTARDRAEPA